jgi:hypothetical protein
MNESIFNEVLDELFSSLESLETQTRALTQYLKDRKIVPADAFAPYLHQAGEASSVRWRAERVRMNSLLTSAFKKVDESIGARLEKAGHDQNSAEKQSDRTETQDAKQARELSNQDSSNQDSKDRDSKNSDSKDSDSKTPESIKPEAGTSEAAKTETSQPDAPNREKTEPTSAQPGASPSKTHEAA